MPLVRKTDNDDNRNSSALLLGIAVLFMVAFGLFYWWLLIKAALMEIVPISFSEACEFVKATHRHHKPPRGHKFSIGLSDGEKIVGVAMIGRPVSRVLDNGWTLEVNRVATDGTKNACSMLYSAAWRAVRAMGYRKLITYILKDEAGTSLKAAGWKCIGETTGRSWTCKSRPRVDRHPLQNKIRYEAA